MFIKRKPTSDKCEKPKRNKLFKYLYLLACVTCITLGWTSAKYISSIEGVVKKGRGADYSYTITNETALTTTDPAETNPKDVNYWQNGATTDSGATLKKYDGVWSNQFYLKNADDVPEITFTVKYKSEVMLRFRINANFLADSKAGESEGAEVESITYTDVDSGYKPAVVEGNENWLLLPTTATEKSLKCTVKLKFGELNKQENHYISVDPMFIQVD